MSNSNGTSTPWAVYPLTRFDSMYHKADIVAGWLIEGLLDVQKLRAALDRLVSKWPMLAGRLESDDPVYMYDVQLRIPLGPLPAGYEPYILTSCESDKPISHYVPLPLPTVSSTLPYHLLRNSKIIPHGNAGWITQQAPLTYWHVTHFKHPGKQEYSCIGLTVSHGLFDGIGVASIMHSLEAEMLGKEWDIPPLLHLGLNANHLQVVLEKAAAEEKDNNATETDAKYESVSIIGLGTILIFVAWIIWQWVWHKTERKLVVIPPNVYEKVVDDARAAMDKESGGQSKVRLSTGDVLSAWITKLVYSDNTSKSRKVYLSNQASVHKFFPQDLIHYPHNCFVPLPVPRLSVEEIRSTPIHKLAYNVAIARGSLSISEPLRLYRDLFPSFKPSKTKIMFLHDRFSDEALFISNTSSSRTAEIDWTAVGGGKTICRYQSLYAYLMLPNLVHITGRLADGSALLDVVMNREKIRVISEEVQRILKEVE